MGFTASTGGFDDNHSIKNVIIYTQMPPSFAGNPLNPPAFCPSDTVQLGGPGQSNLYLYLVAADRPERYDLAGAFSASCQQYFTDSACFTNTLSERLLAITRVVRQWTA